MSEVLKTGAMVGIALGTSGEWKQIVVSEETRWLSSGQNGAVVELGYDPEEPVLEIDGVQIPIIRYEGDEQWPVIPEAIWRQLKSRDTAEAYPHRDSKISEDGRWDKAGLCAEVDPDMFYIDIGEDPQPAIRVCSLCQVRPECLEASLKSKEWYGIWGGLTERQRRKLLRAMGVVDEEDDADDSLSEEIEE